MELTVNKDELYRLVKEAVREVLQEERFDILAGLQVYLERKLGKPVEVIRKRKGLSERFLKHIGDTIQYA